MSSLPPSMQLSDRNKILITFWCFKILKYALWLAVATSLIYILVRMAHNTNYTDGYVKDWRFSSKWSTELWLGSGNEYDTTAQYFALKNYSLQPTVTWNSPANRRGFLGETYYYPHPICDLNGSTPAIKVHSIFYHYPQEYSYRIMNNDCLYTHISPLPYLSNYFLFKILKIDLSKKNIRLYSLVISLIFLVSVIIYAKRYLPISDAVGISFSLFFSYWFFDFAAGSPIYSLDLIVPLLCMILWARTRVWAALLVTALYPLFSHFHFPTLILIPILCSENQWTEAIKNSLLSLTALVIGLAVKAQWVTSLNLQRSSDFIFYWERLTQSMQMNHSEVLHFIAAGASHLVIYLNIALLIMGIVGCYFLISDRLPQRKLRLLIPFALLIWFVLLFDQWKRHTHHLSTFIIPFAVAGSVFLLKTIAPQKKTILIAASGLYAILFTISIALWEPHKLSETRGFHQNLETHLVSFNRDNPKEEVHAYLRNDRLFDSYLNSTPYYFNKSDQFIDLTFLTPIQSLTLIVDQEIARNDLNCTFYDLNDYFTLILLPELKHEVKPSFNHWTLSITFERSVKDLRIACSEQLKKIGVYEIYN